MWRFGCVCACVKAFRCISWIYSIKFTCLKLVWDFCIIWIVAPRFTGIDVSSRFSNSQLVHCHNISAGTILGMGSANERSRYYVMYLLIGRPHTENDCWFVSRHHYFIFSISVRPYPNVFEVLALLGKAVMFHSIYKCTSSMLTEMYPLFNMSLIIPIPWDIGNITWLMIGMSNVVP